MIPPDDGVITYLNRQGFNKSAIRPAAKAYLQTLLFLEESGANESHGAGQSEGPNSQMSEAVNGASLTAFGGAKVGDLIQWEIDGVLQMEKPMRVRLVSADGQYVAVDGSETGIPMDQITVEQRASEDKPQPPMFPMGFGELPQDEPLIAGETEWIANRVGKDTKVQLLVSGGEISAKEIGKLIKLLEAQKAVLTDEDEDDE